MSTQLRAFRPLAPTQTTVAAITATTITLNLVQGTTNLHVANVGTQTVFIKFDGTAATLTDSLPVISNQTEIFTLPSGTTTISIIASAAGSTVYTTVGEGKN